jgi:uncharacterized protein YndB with AHSA1/START domain
MNARLPSILAAPDTVRLERLLPGPVERVWTYLTESDKRAKWLAGGEFELRVGGKIRLEFNHANLSSDKITPEKYRSKGGKGHFEGVITRLEPNRVLAHTWNMGELDSEVTYTLEPRGKEVLLTVVHRRVKPRDLVMSIMSGWDVHTGILEDVLNGVEPRPFWTTHAKLEKEYAARV